MNTTTTTQVMQLVTEHNNGNYATDNRLREMLTKPMLTVCLEICPSFKDAQRVLSEGMKRLFNNLHCYDGKLNFEAWCRSHFVTTAIEYVLYMAEDITNSSGNSVAFRKVA